MKKFLKIMAILPILITGLHASDYKDYDPTEKPSLGNCHKDLKIKIIGPAAIHFCLEEKRLPVVCKDWQKIYSEQEIRYSVLPILTWHSVANQFGFLKEISEQLQDPATSPIYLLSHVVKMQSVTAKWHNNMNDTNGFAQLGKESSGAAGYVLNLSLLCGLVDKTIESANEINIISASKEIEWTPERCNAFNQLCNRYNSCLFDLFVSDGGQGLLTGSTGWNLYTRLKYVYDSLDDLIKDRHGFSYILVQVA